MTKSTLIELLGKFTHKEITQFGDYIRSPFFNKNQSVIKLYEYLRKIYPDFVESKVQKEYTYSVLFPNAQYNDGFMRTIMFNLSVLAEDFLAYIRFKNYHFIEKRNLLYELNERKLDKQIDRNLKEIVKEFEKVRVHDADYYNNKFMIEYEQFYYLNRLGLDKIDKFIDNKEVEDMFNHLTYFYLLHSFKLYVYILNSREIYPIDFKTKLVEDIINSLNPAFYQDIPIFNLYYNLVMLHLRPDDISYFYKVKELAVKYENCINEYEITDAYINMENYCKAMIRKGCSDFNKELFELIKLELEKKVYKVQGLMSTKYYTSAVEIGLKLKEYEWTKDFIETYKNELPIELRENTYLYTLSLYEFSHRNFEKSLDLLSKVKYNEAYHKAELRCLTAELYYELNLEESLLSHLDSFRHFLVNDNHLPKERKQYYMNFIKYVKFINGLRNKTSRIECGQLKDKLAAETVIQNKEWLLNKAEELEKKK